MRYAHLAPSYTAQWVENSRREDELGTKQGTVEIDDEQKPAQVIENMGWLMGNDSRPPNALLVKDLQAVATQLCVADCVASQG